MITKYYLYKLSRLSLVIFFVMSISFSFVKAQETIAITLEKVLEIVGADNLTIKTYQEQQELAMAELSKAKEWWIPDLYAGAKSHHLSGASLNSNGKYFLDVSKDNLWLGLGLDLNWDMQEGLYGVSAKKMSNHANAYLTEAKKNQILLKGVNAYYDLVKAQLNLKSYQKLVSQANIIVDQVQIQVDAGLRYESEVLLAKSNTNHLTIEVLKAKNDFNLASSELLQLLNINLTTILVVADEQLLPLEFDKNINSELDLNNDRPELISLKYQLEALKIKKKTYGKGLLLPTLNLNANTSYFGSFNDVVDPVDAIAYPNPDQLYPTNVLNGSLMWKVPLGSFVYNGNNKKYNSLIKLKEIETEQELVKISQEITIATFRINNGIQQIEIAKQSLDMSLEGLNQSIARQNLGTAKPFEVFQAQQFFLQSQIDYLDAVADYNKAQFALKIARGERI
ncbi:MAG: TolC family protein [Saprospiraceae bacterium]